MCAIDPREFEDSCERPRDAADKCAGCAVATPEEVVWPENSNQERASVPFEIGMRQSTAVEKGLNPFHFVVIVLEGWMNQRQQDVIEYLREETRVLREQLGDRRLRFTDDQRRRLAVRAKGLGRKLLGK